VIALPANTQDNEVNFDSVNVFGTMAERAGVFSPRQAW
jgi:hypothetical protein